jgi:pimeloyl-ACP methyl ester carboxylesterase
MHDDASTIRDVIDTIAGPVAVVAHSYGGIPVTEATADAPTVTNLIYIAAYVPDEDGSMFSLHGFPDPDETAGLFPLIDNPRTSLYADLDDEHAAFALGMLIQQTAKSFSDRVTGAGWKTIPTAFVVCDNDQTIPPAMQVDMGQHSRAAVHHVPSSHSPFLSMPAELAALLDSIMRETPLLTV